MKKLILFLLTAMLLVGCGQTNQTQEAVYMNITAEEAKKMMDENGILIIVGLSRPSGVFDWVLELARIVPSKLISAIKRNISSEEQQMDVSYDFPAMDEVRRICKAHLRGCKLRYGLHYRYLLTWENDGI